MIFQKTPPTALKILFSLSNPVEPAITENELRAIRHGKDDVAEQIYLLGKNNEVLGFIYKGSKRLEVFNEGTKKNLHACYRNTSIKNLQHLSQTLSLLKLLSNNNIDAIPLKGASADDLIFGDFGVYPSSDIDILVHPSQLDETKHLLLQDDLFSQIDSIDENDLLSDHYHLMFNHQNTLFEVHWNLTKRYFEIPASFWWEDTRPIQWNGIDTLELSPERYILYNIFRLFDHCFFPLKFFILLHGIIHKYKEIIDWKKLIHVAKMYKMEKLVVCTLQLLSSMYNSAIPGDILKKRFVGYGIFTKSVLSGVQSGIQRKHQRMLLYSLLLVDPKTLINILLKRVVPSKGELRLRYNIRPGSSKIFIYYLINPFLLLLKKNRG